MRFTRALSSFFLVIFSALFFCVSQTYAASLNAGLSVHPSNFEIDAQPGDTVTKTVTLDNLTTQTVEITIDKKNFTAQGEEGGVDLTSNQITYSLASWITVSPKTITIQPHKSQTFTFKIDFPKNAEPGGHYGAIIFKTIPNPSDRKSGNTVLISEEIVSLILTKVAGNVRENAQAMSLVTDKDFYEFGPVSFDLRVKNKSNVHIEPTGVIKVTGIFGQHFEVPIEQRNILPNAVRKIPATLNKKLLFGKYEASLNVSYGSKNQRLFASTTFYAFPVKYGLIVFGIILVLFLLRRRLFRIAKILITGK